MPQNTLFYPLGDTAPAGKITATSLLLLIPLVNLCLLFGLLFVITYPIFKVIKITRNLFKSSKTLPQKAILTGIKQ